MSASSVSTTASRSFSRYSDATSASSGGISVAFSSRAPSALLYAHMCRRSTMPVTSCSLPIGRWTATQRSEGCERTPSSARKKSARSRSSMFTKMTRASPPVSARFQSRAVPTSTPITAETTTSAPSTTLSAEMASPWKPGSPGVSMRLILRPCHSRLASAACSDIRRRCSSGSQSVVVPAASIVPSRLTAPAWNSIASTSEVLPTPRCPTTATLRSLPGSTATELMLTREAGLQAQDRLRVQLRDARLGDPEHLADLPQGQLLVVVERDDDLLALGQPVDRVGHRLAQLGLVERGRRARARGVLDRVDQGDLVAAAA